MDYNKPQIIKKGDTSFITTHFRASEWYSTSSDAPASHPIYPALLAAAELLRTWFNVPWRITSSYRTEAHERQILKSLGQKFFVDQHMQGRAFDSHPVDVGPAGKAIKQQIYDDFLANGPLYRQLRELGITGFGIYDWGIHLDCRVDSFTAKRKDAYGYVACWDERTNAKKKFGGAGFSPAPKTPATTQTQKLTSPKLSSSATSTSSFQVKPGLGLAPRRASSMDDNPLASPSQLLLAFLGGNLSLVVSTVGPALGFALQILSFISLVLIIIVNWRKIFKPSEKSNPDED